MDYLIIFLLGSVVSGVTAYRFLRKRKSEEAPINDITMHSIVEKMENLGMLNVYKVKTKEIVTATDHVFGDVGARYFNWFVTRKKVAIIFNFEIDFSYDLSRMQIDDMGEGSFRMRLPECHYALNIKEIHFYDEQNGRLMPWLLPEMLSGVFGGFSAEDRNSLIDAAKAQVSTLAQSMMIELLPDVQLAAKSTLEQIAGGLQVQQVIVQFSDGASIENNVNYLPKDGLQA